MGSGADNLHLKGRKMERNELEELMITIGSIVRGFLSSKNVKDSQGQTANIVDALDNIAKGLHRIADKYEEKL
jgi:hypothetical protein